MTDFSIDQDQSMKIQVESIGQRQDIEIKRDFFQPDMVEFTKKTCKS